MLSAGLRILLLLQSNAVVGTACRIDHIQKSDYVRKCCISMMMVQGLTHPGQSLCNTWHPSDTAFILASLLRAGTTV
jgi:hypothetical protein